MKERAKTRFSTAHQSMIRSVISFCLSPENISTTQSVPAFYNLIANVLQPRLETIYNLSTSIASSAKGYAEQNKTLKEKIASQSTILMHAAYSYAISNNNLILAAQMKISRSELIGMKTGIFIPRVDAAMGVIASMINVLGDYNITIAEVNACQDLVNELSARMTLPRNMIAKRKATRLEIQRLLRECVTALYMQCDTVATQFRSTNSNYYSQYHSCRKLRTHQMSTQLRAHIENENGTVRDAEVYIIGTDRSGVTDADGYCLLNELPFGTHEVAVSTPQGTQTFGPYRFKKGQSLTLHLKFTSPPAPFPAKDRIISQT